MRYSKLFRRLLFILPVVAAAGYGLVILGVWYYQDTLMFGRRATELKETPAARQWAYEDVWLDVAGEKTHGWWLPVADARGAVLFSHGSGRNISGHLDDAAFFRNLGFSVLLYDYGGYGQSGGEPSESRCYADSRAMWNHLVNERHIAPENIVLVGCSMGGGITANLAAEVKSGGVILESTFTSIPGVLKSMYWWIPAEYISHIQFRNIDKVPRIQCPVLIVHSRDDTVVPFEEGRRLYDAVVAPKKFVEIHGGHTGGKFDSKDIYGPALKEFLADKGMRSAAGDGRP